MQCTDTVHGAYCQKANRSTCMTQNGGNKEKLTNPPCRDTYLSGIVWSNSNTCGSGKNSTPSKPSLSSEAIPFHQKQTRRKKQKTSSPSPSSSSGCKTVHMMTFNIGTFSSPEHSAGCGMCLPTYCRQLVSHVHRRTTPPNRQEKSIKMVFFWMMCAGRLRLYRWLAHLLWSPNFPTANIPTLLTECQEAGQLSQRQPPMFGMNIFEWWKLNFTST